MAAVVACSGCASGMRAEARGEVVRAVPAILETWLPSQGPMGAGDALAEHVHSLQATGWLVEEWQGIANYGLVHARYSRRPFLVEVPDQRRHESEWESQFSTSAMVTHWVKWSTLFWECFLGSKERFESVALGHYARLISPHAHVFDLIRIRSREPGLTLIQDPIEGVGTRLFQGSIAPLKPGAFPRDSIFGPVSFVEAKESTRSNLGQYTVMEVRDQRSFAAGSVLHAEYGKERGRDTYILALVSRSEVIVLQTLLPEQADRSSVVADLHAILSGGSAP